MYIHFDSLPVDAPLRITSTFGYRTTGIKGASTYHKGVDIGRDFSQDETAVLAVTKGIVIKNYWNDVRGWVIILNHGEFSTLYQHLKEQSKLQVGTEIAAGVQIGKMGASTKSISGMAVHLHFELIADEVSIDPEPYLKAVQSYNKQEGKNAMKRYEKIEEMPQALQKNIQSLVECGALMGKSKENLDISEDMARVLVITKRYADKLFDELRSWNQPL